MSETLLTKEEYSKLWLSFIDGDKEAFSKVYKSSYKKLYSYGMSFKLTDQQTRDIIQDIFLKLYTSPKIVQNASTLRPFIFVMMRNACLNKLKWLQKFSNIDNIDVFEINYSVDATGDEEREHIQITIHNILSQLTPRQREIISLRFLHQMEYGEIASIMELSEQSARNLTSRAIDSIRKKNIGSTFSLTFLLYNIIENMR